MSVDGGGGGGLQNERKLDKGVQEVCFLSNVFDG